MANYIFTRLKIFLSNPIKTIERLKQVELYAQEYQEIFIVQPYFWLFNLVKPGTTIVDIGATIGDTSITLQ